MPTQLSLFLAFRTCVFPDSIMTSYLLIWMICMIEVNKHIITTWFQYNKRSSSNSFYLYTQSSKFFFTPLPGSFSRTPGGFNALYRAYSISTTWCIGNAATNLMFQCPLSGLFHFYFEADESAKEVPEVFQCPLSGLFHFYETVRKSSIRWKKCFNALYRAYSISTLLNLCTSTPVHQVSMPFIGLIPFLHIHYSVRNGSICNVSMPFIGLIPFLQYLPETLAFCGFLSLFLQVFDWIFWKQSFWPQKAIWVHFSYNLSTVSIFIFGIQIATLIICFIYSYYQILL